MDSIARLRLTQAARVARLVDAFLEIPPELAPVERARTQAIREQIYYGYEKPLARAREAPLVWGKYEEDRPWSAPAAALVLEGRAVRGARQLNREHVFEASRLVKLLLERPRDPAETADLLDEKLVTCTVLAEEHVQLGQVGRDYEGWARYAEAQIAVQGSLRDG